jgi:hypothetical protein
LGYTQSFGLNVDPQELGLDFAIEFQPKFDGAIWKSQKTVWTKVINSFKRIFNNQKDNSNSVIEYSDYVQSQMKKTYDDKIIPCITPGWDNSARRKTNAFILNNSTPKLYSEWLSHVITNYPWSDNRENFLFINAWNEWAEGNHLEPCQKWGKQFLENTQKELERKNRN